MEPKIPLRNEDFSAMMAKMTQRPRAWFFGLLAFLIMAAPLPVLASGGMSVAGGGNFVVGQTFTVTVTASGGSFNALQGTISVSGPVSIVSFSPGSFSVFVGQVADGKFFAGTTSSPTTSLRVATIKLKGTQEGSGAVSVSSVRLANAGSEVGTSGGSTKFTIGRAPTPPGGVEVSSSTHPDQGTAYEATTATFSWKAPANGADGYSTDFNESDSTVPAAKISTTDTTATVEGIAIGVHYFHVRAHNGDGWGPTAHFKITVKEPDAKIDTTLTAPTVLSIEKAGNFINDVNKGTVSGIVIKGSGGQAGFTTNLMFDPADHLPRELFAPVPVTAENTTDKTAEAVPAETPVLTPLQAVPDATGNWQVVLTYPMPSGFYALTAQNQKDKTLSPVSSPVHIELSVANGGSVKIISDDDLPKTKISEVKVLGIQFKDRRHAWTAFGAVGVVLLITAAAAVYLLWWRRRRPV